MTLKRLVGFAWILLGIHFMAWTANAQDSAPRRDPPTRLRAGNPANQRIIALATALQSEYTGLQQSVARWPLGAGQTMARLERYRRIFQMYWQAVGRYDAIEQARQEDPVPLPLPYCGPPLAPEKAEGELLLISSVAAPYVQQLVEGRDEIDAELNEQLGLAVFGREGETGHAPPQDPGPGFTFKFPREKTWVIRTREELARFRQEIAAGGPLEPEEGGSDEASDPLASIDLRESMVIAAATGTSQPPRVSGGSTMSVGLGARYHQVSLVRSSSERNGHLIIVPQYEGPVYVNGLGSGPEGNGINGAGVVLTVNPRMLPSDGPSEPDLRFQVDENGRWSCQELPSTDFTIEIDHPGYLPARIQVTDGKVPRLIVLMPAPAPAAGDPASGQEVATARDDLNNPFGN